MFMVPSQVDGCNIVNLDDVFEAVDKQMHLWVWASALHGMYESFCGF